MATGELIEHDMNAAESLPRDLAVLKMENDQIFSLAAARPRDFAKVRQELSSMIETFPQFADEAIYEKPVGMEPDRCNACGEEVFRRKGTSEPPAVCPVCRAENSVVAGKMKYARGLSVRSAECLAECYGYNRIHTDVEALPDGRVKIYASFTDYQRGRTWGDSSIVSPFYKSRRGTTERHPEDRFLNVIVKAEKSKLVREVINRSVNQALKAWFENECEKKLAQTLTDDVVSKIVAGFAAYGMTLEQVEKIVGRPKSMGWMQADRVRLLGVFNALKSGETTVAEVLGAETTTKPQTTTGTVDELSNPRGRMDESRKDKVEKPAETKTPETAVETDTKPKADPPKQKQKPLEPVTTTTPPPTTTPQTKTASAKLDYAEQFESAQTIDALHEMNIELATDDRVTDEERARLLDVFKRRKESLSKK
jgi:predicted Zn-ribbon and HTH transcriptional regulator